MPSTTPGSGPSVLLLTEGTYPFVGGGVSTWCDVVLRGLPESDIHVIAVTGSPGVQLHYELPGNVRSVQIVPLWGTAEPTEHSRFGEPFAKTVLHRERTGDAAVRHAFLPLFRRLLDALAEPERVGRDGGDLCVELSVYFRRYDYRATFRSEPVWTAYRDWALAAARADGDPEPMLGELVQGLRWVYNFLLPLTVPLPRTDVAHATLAGFGALPGVVARCELDVPLVVTDHGIYLRERYIAMAGDTSGSFFARRTLLRLTHLVSRIVYTVADQISPVCDHNRRWELRMGATADRIETIYNGIDTERFRPPAVEPARAHPTVVTAARVFPLKDLETLIRACDVTRRRVPDVRFIVYGNHDVDPDYTARCRALITELGVDAHFDFAGFHDTPSELYHDGDVFALSSISEGFPFSVIEAMACGRPCVATDVGGVREAVEGYGIVVPPRGFEALGEGLADLLLDADRRAELAARGRARIVEAFQEAGMVEAYRETYARLAAGAPLPEPPPGGEADEPAPLWAGDGGDAPLPDSPADSAWIARRRAPVATPRAGVCEDDGSLVEAGADPPGEKPASWSRRLLS